MNTPTSAKLYGSIIRRLRKRAGLKQEGLAEKADCHPTYISLLERGKRNPSLDMVIRLSHALDWPAWRLLRITERRL